MSLQDAISKIEKAYGKGNIMKMSESNKIEKDDLSTGILGLDWALGVGGFPLGRVIEIYGQQAVGKSTIALSTIAAAQQKNIQCAYIDVEYAMNPDFAKMIGVNPDQLYISQPNSGDDALNITEMLVASGDIRLVVVDSVAALVPKAELEGDMSDMQMGLQARLMAKGLRKLTAIMSKSNCSIIFINQLRQTMNPYGPSEVTTGGKSLPYYASIRLEVKKGEILKNGEDIFGHEIKVKVVKNKVAPPYKACVFDLNYTKGISSEGMLIDIAIDKGIIKRAGAWYSYDDNKIGQGIEAAKNYLRDNPEFKQMIIGKVMANEE
jgi:recombination protein RecA